MTDKNRLFQLYQTFEALIAGEYCGDEYDQFYMPIGETGDLPEIDAATMIDIANAIIEIESNNSDDFEDNPPTLDEVFEALEIGPSLCREHAENMYSMLSDWKTKFPECETFGDYKEAIRLAGPNLQ